MVALSLQDIKIMKGISEREREKTKNTEKK
jgi:hypothetical protein